MRHDTHEGSTHWDGCEEDHHECAYQMLVRLRRDAERMDWIVDNYCSVGGGNGFEVKFWIPLDTECLRDGIDFCIANKVTAANPLGDSSCTTESPPFINPREVE